MLALKEQTMLGNIPNNWRVKPLISLLSSHYPGEWGEERGANMFKVLRSTNLTNNGRLDLSDVAVRSLKPEMADLLMPKSGDILLERSGGGPDQPVGRIGFVDFPMQGYAFSNFLHLLRPDADRIHPRFLGWILWQINRTKRILRLEQQTTQMRNLNYRDYLSMPLPVPSDPEEQKAIARILDAADTAIEQTREAVKLAGDLRKALIQASFNFELCSEPLKDTDFGRIPRTWEWAKGKKAFVILSGGTNESSIKLPNNQTTSDAWFMKVDDFNNPINRRSIVRTKVGFQAAANPKIKLLPKGTVIIAKRGAAILKNRVRTSAVPLVLDPNLMGIQMCDDIAPEFFAYQLEWRNLSRFLEDSGIPQLNNKDLYPRYFLRAPESEQREMVAVIKAAEDQEDALLDQLDAYESLKRALMDDLLTGKVRVNHAIDKILSSEVS